MIDNHCHISTGKLEKEKDRIASELEEDNIKYVIDTGTDVNSSIEASKFALKYDRVYATVGIQPEEIRNLQNDYISIFEEIYKTNNKVVAIGEIGLDYHYEDNPSKEIQKKVLLEQLELANTLNSPIVLHIRDAFGDFMDIVRNNKKYFSNGFLMHCFSGSVEIANELIKLGSYFSFGGLLTFKNATERKRVFSLIDIDRVIPETDSPYMTPEPYRGQINEPKYVKYVLAKMAEIRGISIEEINNITDNNSSNLFRRTN
ncbi:MAG: TatD family hydrolase [Clostridia bacterium]|nr:TatD family hydrolase [Clostridia bacterium]